MAGIGPGGGSTAAASPTCVASFHPVIDASRFPTETIAEMALAAAGIDIAAGESRAAGTPA